MKMSLAAVMALVLGVVPMSLNAQQPGDGVRSQTQPPNRQLDQQQRTNNPRAAIGDEDKVVPQGLVRASQMIDKAVYNSQQEQIGTIGDVVLDAKTGKIKYVALSSGGFLGLGDSMFAVPYEAFTTQIQDEEKVCVLNVTQEQLENAKGFDQEKWPNQPDATWMTGNTRPQPRSTTSLNR
jgi:sporulation protein YlmC with PRC-barrel domain